MIYVIIFILIGLSFILFFNNRQLKKEILNRDAGFKELLDDNRFINESFEKELKLEKLFTFYIGDYFHNFGNNNWMQVSEYDEFTLSKEACYFIQNIFTAIRYTYSAHKSLVLVNSLELLDFEKELEEEVKNYFNTLDELGKRKMIYQLIIIAMKRSLPEITNGAYTFSNEEMFPTNLNGILDQKLAVWDKV